MAVCQGDHARSAKYSNFSDTSAEENTRQHSEMSLALPVSFCHQVRSPTSDMQLSSFEKPPQASLRWNIARRLGAGACGEVYYGTLDSYPVAVKVLFVRPSRQTNERAFQRELRRYAAMNKVPGIVRSYGAGWYDGRDDSQPLFQNGVNHERTSLQSWHCAEISTIARSESCTQRANIFAMELMLGGSLLDAINADAMKRTPLSILAKLELAARAAHALSTIHAAGFSHGDVKPGNILLSRSLSRGSAHDDSAGSDVQVKFVDLGSSRDFRKPDYLPNTRCYPSPPPTPAVVAVTSISAFADGKQSKASEMNGKNDKNTKNYGTPAYIAPEAWRGAAALDDLPKAAAADVYALGMTLYHLETGVQPWKHSTEWQIFTAVVKRQKRPNWPSSAESVPGIRALVRSCWQSDYSQRPSASVVSCCLWQLIRAHRTIIQQSQTAGILVDSDESSIQSLLPVKPNKPCISTHIAGQLGLVQDTAQILSDSSKIPSLYTSFHNIQVASDAYQQQVHCDQPKQQGKSMMRQNTIYLQPSAMASANHVKREQNVPDNLPGLPCAFADEVGYTSPCSSKSLTPPASPATLSKASPSFPRTMGVKHFAKRAFHPNSHRQQPRQSGADPTQQLAQGSPNDRHLFAAKYPETQFNDLLPGSQTQPEIRAQQNAPSSEGGVIVRCPAGAPIFSAPKGPYEHFQVPNDSDSSDDEGLSEQQHPGTQHVSGKQETLSGNIVDEHTTRCSDDLPPVVDGITPSNSNVFTVESRQSTRLVASEPSSIDDVPAVSSANPMPRTVGRIALSHLHVASVQTISSGGNSGRIFPVTSSHELLDDLADEQVSNLKEDVIRVDEKPDPHSDKDSSQPRGSSDRDMISESDSKQSVCYANENRISCAVSPNTQFGAHDKTAVPVVPAAFGHSANAVTASSQVVDLEASALHGDATSQSGRDVTSSQASSARAGTAPALTHSRSSLEDNHGDSSTHAGTGTADAASVGNTSKTFEVCTSPISSAVDDCVHPAGRVTHPSCAIKEWNGSPQRLSDCGMFNQLCEAEEGNNGVTSQRGKSRSEFCAVPAVNNDYPRYALEAKQKILESAPTSPSCISSPSAEPSQVNTTVQSGRRDPSMDYCLLFENMQRDRAPSPFLRQLLAALSEMLSRSDQGDRELFSRFALEQRIDVLVRVVSRHGRGDAELCKNFADCISNLAKIDSSDMARELSSSNAGAEVMQCLSWHPSSHDVRVACLQALEALTCRSGAMRAVLVQKGVVRELQRVIMRCVSRNEDNIDLGYLALRTLASIVESEAHALIEDDTLTRILQLCECVKNVKIDAEALRILRIAVKSDEGRRKVLDPNSVQKNRPGFLIIFTGMIQRCDGGFFSLRRACSIVRSLTSTRDRLALDGFSSCDELINLLLNILLGSGSCNDERDVELLVVDALRALWTMAKLSHDVRGALLHNGISAAACRVLQRHGSSETVLVAVASLVEDLAKASCWTADDRRPLTQAIDSIAPAWSNREDVSNSLRCAKSALESRIKTAEYPASVGSDIFSADEAEVSAASGMFSLGHIGKDPEQQKRRFGVEKRVGRNSDAAATILHGRDRLVPRYRASTEKSAGIDRMSQRRKARFTNRI